jgi:hypothetical protein
LAQWTDFVRRYVQYQHVKILLTLPDPGPDEFSRFARMVELVQVELGGLAQEDPKMARLIAQELARRLQASPQLLLAAEGHRSE